jgi:hypothetical protein
VSLFLFLKSIVCETNFVLFLDVRFVEPPYQGGMDEVEVS